MIKTSADTLLSVVNDVLDFSKIEAGRLDIESVEFRLSECVGDVMKGLAFRAHEKKLELAYEIPPEIPELLVGDPMRSSLRITGRSCCAWNWRHGGNPKPGCTFP